MLSPATTRAVLGPDVIGSMTGRLLGASFHYRSSAPFGKWPLLDVTPSGVDLRRPSHGRGSAAGLECVLATGAKKKTLLASFALGSVTAADRNQLESDLSRSVSKQRAISAERPHYHPPAPHANTASFPRPAAAHCTPRWPQQSPQAPAREAVPNASASASPA